MLEHANRNISHTDHICYNDVEIQLERGGVSTVRIAQSWTDT